MSIDFFNSGCGSQASSFFEFGLCDDDAIPKDPAYLDELNSSTWIAKVLNEKRIGISFYPIDKCIALKKSSGKQDKICDGLLLYTNKLIFVELKSRKSRKWFQEGREQLTSTIRHFVIHHQSAKYTSIEAYVCNNQKPRFHSGQMSNINQFKEDTGYILKSGEIITII